MLAAWFTSLTANGTGILYQFDTPFPSDPNPAGPVPWIQAAFTDITPGTVLMTISNVNLTSGEFVKGNGNGANGGLFFNLNPNDNPANLTFSLISSNGNFGTTISKGVNAFKADGDGKYDIQFDFSGNNFSTGSSIAYRITGISGLTAADFAFLSAPAGGSGPFYAAAHVQGLPASCGGDSTWIEPGRGPLSIIPVPEPVPGAFLALLLGLWGVWFMRVRSLRLRPARVSSERLRVSPQERISSRSR